MFLLPGSFLALALALASAFSFAFGALVPLVFVLSAFSVLFGALLWFIGLVALHHVIRQKFRVLFWKKECKMRATRNKHCCE